MAPVNLKPFDATNVSKSPRDVPGPAGKSQQPASGLSIEARSSMHSVDMPPAPRSPVPSRASSEEVAGNNDVASAQAYGDMPDDLGLLAHAAPHAREEQPVEQVQPVHDAQPVQASQAVQDSQQAPASLPLVARDRILVHLLGHPMSDAQLAMAPVTTNAHVRTAAGVAVGPALGLTAYGVTHLASQPGMADLASSKMADAIGGFVGTLKDAAGNETRSKLFELAYDLASRGKDALETVDEDIELAKSLVKPFTEKARDLAGAAFNPRALAEGATKVVEQVSVAGWTALGVGVALGGAATWLLRGSPEEGENLKAALWIANHPSADRLVHVLDGVMGGYPDGVAVARSAFLDVAKSREGQAALTSLVSNSEQARQRGADALSKMPAMNEVSRLTTSSAESKALWLQLGERAFAAVPVVQGPKAEQPVVPQEVMKRQSIAPAANAFGEVDGPAVPMSQTDFMQILHGREMTRTDQVVMATTQAVTGASRKARAALVGVASAGIGLASAGLGRFTASQGLANGLQQEHPPSEGWPHNVAANEIISGMERMAGTAAHDATLEGLKTWEKEYNYTVPAPYTAEEIAGWAGGQVDVDSEIAVPSHVIMCRFVAGHYSEQGT